MCHCRAIGHKHAESFVSLPLIYWRTAVESDQNFVLVNFNEILLVTSDSFGQLKQ